MKTTLKSLLTVTRDAGSSRATQATIGEAIKAGFIVWSYTPFPRTAADGSRFVSDGYVLTDAGRAALEAATAVKSAAPHGPNCRCPRCAVGHVKNGCRRLPCPVCG